MATRDSESVEALRAVIVPLGFELVEAEWVGPAARRELRVRIDREGGSLPGRGVTADDCRLVSRTLEESGLAADAARIEVSSPGIERPVRFAEHWLRYVGRDVRLKATGVSGTVTARIVGVPDPAHVTVRIGSEERTVALDAVRRATLVVDWDEIGSTGKQEKH
jgi:ribosome maturation factor RimP